MINQNYELLYTKLCQAREKLRTLENPDEKIALINYMENLYDALLGLDVNVDEIDIYENAEQSYRYFCQTMRENDAYLVIFFTKNSKMHEEYLGDVLQGLREDFSKKKVPNGSLYFSKNTFLNVLFQFFKEIHLEGLFDQVIHSSSVYSFDQQSIIDSPGFVIYNPLTADSDIFIKDFRYDLEHMGTLVHEIGHYYDFSHSFSDIKDFNQYFYMSCNREVISTLMERLFQRFLLKHNISDEEVKKYIRNFDQLSYEFIENAYMFSLLDEKFLSSYANGNQDFERVFHSIQDSLVDKKELRRFLNHYYEYNLSDTYNYAYGDILSLFLCEEIEREGFSNDLMNSFFLERDSLFSTSFLEKHQFTSEKCKKLYKKEIALGK